MVELIRRFFSSPSSIREGKTDKLNNRNIKADSERNTIKKRKVRYNNKKYRESKFLS